MICCNNAGPDAVIYTRPFSPVEWTNANPEMWTSDGRGTRRCQNDAEKGLRFALQDVERSGNLNSEGIAYVGSRACGK